MKIVITGASGLLGRACMRIFADLAPIGIVNSRQRLGCIALDLEDTARTTQIIEELKPDVIIHTAVKRRLDVIEKDAVESNKINVLATAHLARLAKHLNAWLLYISTDYVFDGAAPPYRVDAVPNPLSKYGKNKLEGEFAILNIAPRGGILRLPLLFGQVERVDESSVSYIFQQICAGKIIKLDDVAKRYPTWVDDVASVCRQLVERFALTTQDLKTWHWSGDECYTRYQLALYMCDIFNLPVAHLVADNSLDLLVFRPYDSQLDCFELESLNLGCRTPLKNALLQTVSESPVLKALCDFY